jgi:hypothetical protein
MGIAAAAIIVWALLRTHTAPLARPEIEALKPLEKRLLQTGYKRAASETLSVYLQRVAMGEPQWAPSLKAITQLFEQVAYQHKPEQLHLLKQAINKFPALIK